MSTTAHRFIKNKKRLSCPQIVSGNPVGGFPIKKFGNDMPGCRFILLTIISLLLTSTSFAQQTHRFAQQGVLEAGGSVSYMRQTIVENGTNAYGISTLTLTPYIGYFISDNFELGVNPLGISYSDAPWGSLYQLRIFAAPAYHFKSMGNEHGFIEPLLGYTAQFNGNTRGGFSFGGRAGVKLQVTEGGLLVFAVQYLAINLSPENAAARFGYNELSFSAGFTVWR